MKVLLDAYYISKPRGLGRYVRELLNALATFPEAGIEIHALVPRGSEASLVGADRIHYQEAAYLPFPLWEQWTLPRVRRKMGADVVHSLASTLPVIDRDFPGQVVTIHDLMYLDPHVRPGTLYQRIGKTYRRWITAATRNGRYEVITLTNTIAREISQKLGRSAAAINLPVEAGLSLPTAANAPCVQPYFLHVGGSAPHKNTPRTVDAFLRAAPSDHRLVVLGMGAEWKDRIAGANARIIFPGWIDEATVATYYRHATAALFPSLSEGYGIPIVEALAFGLPLITSDRDPMRELACGAAILIDPENTEALAEAIGNLARDSTLRDSLKQAGQQVARRYTAETMSRLIHATYRKVAGR